MKVSCALHMLTSLFLSMQLDRQRGRCPPEWTKEVFGMHLNMGVIEGLDRITQPVVSLLYCLTQFESMISH